MAYVFVPSSGKEKGDSEELQRSNMLDIWDELESILLAADSIVVKKSLVGYATQIRYTDQDSQLVNDIEESRPVTRVVSTRPSDTIEDNVIRSLLWAIDSYKFDDYTHTM